MDILLVLHKSALDIDWFEHGEMYSIITFASPLNRALLADNAVFFYLHELR